MLLLVGLGNPGPAYANNRHNIGYRALDAIRERHRFGPMRPRFEGVACEGMLGTERVLALKPTTYMNESGRSVAAARRFYRLPTSRIIVIHDDLDLAPAKMRVKCGGGAGGHNGLRSIDAHLGPEYWRVRLGIGRPDDKDGVADYVLQDFAKADRAWLDKLLDALAEHMPILAAGDEASFMNRVALALKPPRPKPSRPTGTPQPSTPRSGATDD